MKRFALWIGFLIILSSFVLGAFGGIGNLFGPGTPPPHVLQPNETRWAIYGPYLYNNNEVLDFNESYLNETISGNINDTHIQASGPYLYSTFLYMYFNETKLNETVSTLDTNTWWPLTPGWLWNNSNQIDFNDTRLNETITALDTDTHIEGVSPYLSDNYTHMIFNETKLNDTINNTLVWIRIGNEVYLLTPPANVSIDGELNMTNHSIWKVWELEVHNITGGSPIYVGDELIAEQNVIATKNITVQDRVIANTYVGNNITFIDKTNGTILAVLNPTNYSGWGTEYGDLTARTMTIDRLIITGLLNYSNTEPPDVWNSDEIYIYEYNFTFYFNESKMNQTIQSQINATDTHIEGTPPYLYDNFTHMLFNETQLNNTIEVTAGIREEYINISVSGGVGNATTVDCCFPTGEVLQLAVYPITPTNSYKFSANGTISGDVVDTDRRTHVGDWIIAHSGTTLINESINLYVTSATIDEIFTVRIRWRI